MDQISRLALGILVISVDVAEFAGATLVGAYRIAVRHIWCGRRWRYRHHLLAILDHRPAPAIAFERIGLLDAPYAACPPQKFGTKSNRPQNSPGFLG
jgi:hypothetical protein